MATNELVNTVLMTPNSNDQTKTRAPSAGIFVLFLLVLITGFDLGPVSAAILFLAVAFTLTMTMISKQKSVLTPILLVIIPYVLAFPTSILFPDYFQTASNFFKPTRSIF